MNRANRKDVLRMAMAAMAVAMAVLAAVGCSNEAAEIPAPKAPEILVNGSSVTMATSTDGAEIWYMTTSGEEAIAAEQVRKDGKRYEGAVEVAGSCTIHAVASANGVLSEVSRRTVEIASPEAPRDLSISFEGNVMTIGGGTEGADIWYKVTELGVDRPTAGVIRRDGKRYEGPVTLEGNGTVSAVAVANGLSSNAVSVDFRWYETGKPAFSGSAAAIGISYGEEGDWEIRYTLDGSVPSAGSALYEGEIAGIAGTTTVKAIAAMERDGVQYISEVATLEVVKLAVPTISGRIDNVAMATESEGAEIYYTSADKGSAVGEPTSASTKYVEGRTSFLKPVDIRAIAHKADEDGKVFYIDSDISEVASADWAGELEVTVAYDAKTRKAKFASNAGEGVSVTYGTATSATGSFTGSSSEVALEVAADASIMYVKASAKYYKDSEPVQFDKGLYVGRKLTYAGYDADGNKKDFDVVVFNTDGDKVLAVDPVVLSNGVQWGANGIDFADKGKGHEIADSITNTNDVMNFKQTEESQPDKPQFASGENLDGADPTVWTLLAERAGYDWNTASEDYTVEKYGWFIPSVKALQAIWSCSDLGDNHLVGSEIVWTGYTISGTVSSTKVNSVLGVNIKGEFNNAGRAYDIPSFVCVAF